MTQDANGSRTAVPQGSPFQTDPTAEDGENSRRYGLRDGACQAITQGSGEQYLSAFALLWHAGPFQLALLSALPQLIGTVAQLASVKLLQWFPDRKALIQAGTVGQGFAWIPIMLLPLAFPESAPWLVVAGAALYFVFAHFTAPSWTSFIADHVNQHERGAYFARRALIVAGVSFLTLCAAGALLTVWQGGTAAWIGFALIFTLAGSARLVSAFAIRSIQDRPHEDAHAGGSSFRAFFAQSSRGFRQFLLFSGCMHVAVLIAGPFFVLYMLRDLHFTYLEYGAWLAAGVLGQVCTLRGWGRFGDRYGNKALLTVTGYTVPILPMLYLFSTSLVFMMIVNFLGGVVWAGLALGLQNYVFDAVKPEDRTKAIAVNNAVNACGWCAGAVVGGWLVDMLPSVIPLSRIPFPLASHLPLVFLLSGLLRLAVVRGFVGRFHETRTVERASLKELLVESPILKTIALVLGNPLSRPSK